MTGRRSSQAVVFSTLLGFGGLVLAALGACGDDGSGAGGTDGQACTPGATQPCTCTTGALGAQSCEMDGSGYGECECAGDTEAGACPTGQTLCDGACVDTGKDGENCGACENACAQGEVCSAGTCTTSCQAGLTECDGTCTNTQSDREHCGGCEDACAAGEVCSAGACAVSCQLGLTECDGTCVNTDTAASHCGGCGQACQAGEVCSAGTCAPTCQAGLIECDGVCTNTEFDPQHCSMCQNACANNEVCKSGSCELAAQCPSGSYVASKVMDVPVAYDETPRGMAAWDGTDLWTAIGTGLARYHANGNDYLSWSCHPGIDFRSIFTKGDGGAALYMRAYASPQILIMPSPCQFANNVTLMGHLDDESAVVFDAIKSEFIAHEAGTIERWSDAGDYVGAFTLLGYGSMNGEGGYPQNNRVAMAKWYFLTYSKQILSCWDDTGTRLSTATLVGAGTSFDSHFSLSYAQGRVWIVDDAAEQYRGYHIGIGP